MNLALPLAMCHFALFASHSLRGLGSVVAVFPLQCVDQFDVFLRCILWVDFVVNDLLPGALLGFALEASGKRNQPSESAGLGTTQEWLSTISPLTLKSNVPGFSALSMGGSWVACL